MQCGTKDEAVALLTKLQNRELDEVDVSLSNGAIFSRKDLTACSDGFQIFHSIDGTMVHFTFDEAVEVLLGKRSPWGELLIENLGISVT